MWITFIKIVKLSVYYYPENSLKCFNKNPKHAMLAFYLFARNKVAAQEYLSKQKKPLNYTRTQTREHLPVLLESFMTLCSIKSQRKDRSKLQGEPPS